MSILQNAVKITTCKTPRYIVSTHTHDCNGTRMKNGNSVMVDGGKSYIRRGYGRRLDGYEEFSLATDATMDECINKLLWGTRGIKGNKPVRYILLKDCSTKHLQAILKTQDQIEDTVFSRVIREILTRRKNTQ